MKILVVRFSSIGDIVLTSPIVRCIKQQVQSSEVHYLTKNSFKSILLSNPYIDKVFGFDKSISEIIAELKNEKYDFVVDLHHNIRSKSLTYQLRIPYSRFPKLHILKWLYVYLKTDRLPKKHVIERYFEAIRKLGVKNDLLPCDYFIPKEDEIDPKESYGVFPNEFNTFSIGAQFKTKRLPLNKLIEICLKSELKTVLLGGKDDYQVAYLIEQELGDKVINTCGKLNLNQSASLLKQANTVITHDTGLMHIASSFGKKIVSIWGNTSPSFGMYVYNPIQTNQVSIHQVMDLSCRPCSKIGFKECPKTHFNCMNLQKVETIIKDIN